MNKHQIDRLFEEKLGTVHQEPSDSAKASFDQLLAQKHKKPVFIWWRVAAVLLLLGVSTITYLSWLVDEEQPLTAELPERETSAPLANNTNPSETSTKTQELNAEKEAEQTMTSPEIEVNELSETAPMLAENDKTVEVVKEPMQEIPSTPDLSDITDATATVAVAKNEEREPQVTPEQVRDEITIEKVDEMITAEVAIAVNEAPVEEAPKKKRLPVTIIYKSSSADQSLIAMQDIRTDVDSLSGESANSLKSILQSAGNGSLIAEIKKAKEDLFNLDIPLKSKKANN